MNLADLRELRAAIDAQIEAHYAELERRATAGTASQSAAIELLLQIISDDNPDGKGATLSAAGDKALPGEHPLPAEQHAEQQPHAIDQTFAGWTVKALQGFSGEVAGYVVTHGDGRRLEFAIARDGNGEIDAMRGRDGNPYTVRFLRDHNNNDLSRISLDHAGRASKEFAIARDTYGHVAGIRPTVH